MFTLERPDFRDFMPDETTVMDILDFQNDEKSKGLFRYAQSLDRYIDEITSPDQNSKTI